MVQKQDKLLGREGILYILIYFCSFMKSTEMIIKAFLKRPAHEDRDRKSEIWEAGKQVNVGN